MKRSKILVFIYALTFSLSLFAQPSYDGGDGSGRRIHDFQDQRQSLIDSFMDSRDDRINSGDDFSGPIVIGRDNISGSIFTGGDDADGVKLEGGTHTGPNNQRLIDDEGQPIQIHSLQQALGRRTNDPAGVAAIPQERKAPMRLYFDQIHFESDEVSEVTLKDGTVVTTQELQEFAKEVILKKLNEQK